MTSRVATILFVLAASGFLAGCGGPGEEDFVQACMKGQGATEEACRCMASEAKAKMPAKGWEALVLDAQEKDAEAEAVRNSMSTEDQAKMMGAMLEVAGKCMAGMQ